MKNILIAGANSYIGKSLREYLSQYPEDYNIELLRTRNLKPDPSMFAGIDVVFCAAGIAHVKETKANRHLYYEVNRDLVVDIARNAKAAGVQQFILLSSMAVYGLETGTIDKRSIPHPITAYGESKLMADEEIKKLDNERFIFTCLRPPMVYGKNCAGNYQSLRSFALKSPVFPNYSNHRSMIYVGNLCYFIKICIDFKRSGLYFPQNNAYVNTSEMVKAIAEVHGKKIKLTKVFNWAIKLVPLMILKKVFGSLTYEPVDMVDAFEFEESIRLTEGE